MPTALRLPLQIPFPAEAVETCLRDALALQAEQQLILHGDEPAAPTPQWEPEIDSLVVVELLCAVEELLGFELPASFAPKGGYQSVQACIDDLMERAMAAWEAHQGGA